MTRRIAAATCAALATLGIVSACTSTDAAPNTGNTTTAAPSDRTTTPVPCEPIGLRGHFDGAFGGKKR